MNDLELYAERAAIREFCAGMTRENAEQLARVDVLAIEAKPIEAKWRCRRRIGVKSDERSA